MKVTALDKALRFFGLDPERKEGPPDLHAIAQGLLVTGNKTEAWFNLGTTNTDIADEDALDHELDSIIAAAGNVLEGKECHLKIVWGRITSEQYLDDAESMYTQGNWQAWAEQWAETIEHLGMLERYLLLGVKISDRTKQGSAAKNAVGDALGLDTRRVSKSELLYSLRKAQEIGRPLRNTKWRAQLASADLIAWMTAREQHRDNLVAPVDGIIDGERLARLTSGRVVPYTDHLRAYAADGTVASYIGVMTLFSFPEDMEVPGDQEWLRGLGTITRNSEGNIVPVVADASVRFKVLTKRESKKLIEDTRKVAKEQRSSAGQHSTGETSETIENTEAIMSNLGSRIDRDQSLRLVRSHPRIVVRGSSYDELMKNAAAVTHYYNSIGISAEIGADEQRELWLETHPGDLVRVSDLGHVQDGYGFFGSYFWGGSKVGSKSGPVIGAQTGTTSGIVRFGAADAAARGDATTTFYGGRSGRGKSTGMVLDILETVFCGGWGTLLDFKGDLSGAVRVAKEFGLPHGVIEITPEYAGSADPFAVLPAEDAVLAVTRQLTLMAPKRYLHIAESTLLGAAMKEAESATAEGSNPSSWGTIRRLVQDSNEEVSALGTALENLARTDLGSIIAGQPTGLSALSREPGLWVAQFPNLTLPEGNKAIEDLDASERLALAVMRGFIQYVLSVSSSKDLRSMKKIIGIPEVHRLLRMPDGADFLDVSARMGRAFGSHLVIDSQDIIGVASHEGLVEQLSAVFIFQLTSKAQQDAATELLQRQPSAQMRKLIYDIGINYSDDEDNSDVTDDEFFGGSKTVGEGKEREEMNIRHGHCIYFDWQARAATMQRLFPSALVQELLSTNPDAELKAAYQEIYEEEEAS